MLIFCLPLYVVFRIFELADTSAQTTHQFGDLLTTKQKKHHKRDEYSMQRTE